MKTRRMLVIVVILLGLLVVLPGVGDARGGGHGGGFHGGGHGGGRGHFDHGGGSRVFIGGFFGFPFYPYGPYGYYPYYSYPYPNYSYDTQPTVYVEPQEDSEWYYCQDSQGYYPYVTSCPGGWTRVVSTPLQPGEEDTVK